MAIASFLMYQSSLAGASMTVKVVYMYATYLLWGSICYTGINIPYGSMASAITEKPEERTALSTFRGVGAKDCIKWCARLLPFWIACVSSISNSMSAVS